MHRTRFVQKNIFGFCFEHDYAVSVSVVNEFEEELLQGVMVLVVSFTVFLLGICLLWPRSFTELPGLNDSTFANTKASISLTILFNLTKGVFPIVSKIFLQYCMPLFESAKIAEYLAI